MNFIYAFLILLGVITIHEFGHFIFAKMLGIRVYEFAIGMGPKIYSKKGKNTLFSIRLLPLGGFCRFDTDEEKQDEVIDLNHIEFEKSSKFKKVVILFGGVFMNFLTAIVLLVLLFQINGYPSTVVKDIVPNSIAEQLEILTGDRILKIDDIKIKTASELMNTTNYKSKKYKLLIERDGEEIVKDVYTPDGKIGIYFDVEKDFLNSIVLSFKTIGIFIREIFKALKNIFSNNTQNLMGVVGFVATVGNMQGINFNIILMIIVNISISLAIFNLIPITPLDGGHILITVIEGIIGRDLSDRAKNIIMSIGLLFILYIFTRSLVNDFSRF